VLRAIREDEAAAASLGKNARTYRLQAFALGGAIMGLAGAMQGHFIGFIAPDNYLSAVTFQVWAMLIVGGSGNNRGAVLGAIVVWGLWSASSALTATLFPPADQARAASLQIVAIGVLLAVILVWRPRGLLGEEMTVSRFVTESGRRHRRGNAPDPDTTSET
jgi:branched-chain amino acid transport system permease protein